MVSKKTIILLSSLVLSLGIFGAGICIGKAVYMSKFLNRHVTVKGLTERDVKSDLGIWEISYKEIGGNLAQLNQQLDHDKAVVIEFLKKNGFNDQEMEMQPIKLEDKLANAYNQPANEQLAAAQRYVLTGAIRVRSTRVNLIQQANQATGTLLQQGIQIVLDSANIVPNPSYYFTQLDSIRPNMLSEATKSAENIAVQFARDAHLKLGGIQSANQGIFQIMNRDTSTLSADWNSTQSALGSIDKKVRLVTTIDYRLK